MSPVLVLNGWGYTPVLWQALAGKYGTSVLFADNPHADTLEGAADALATTIPDGCRVLGWSLGAMLALCLAQRHPERVSKLVLIGASPCFVQRPDWPHGLDATLVDRFRQDFTKQAERTRKRFLALQLMDDCQRHTLLPRLEAALDTDPAASATQAQGLALLASSDLRGTLNGVQCDCQLIHGEQDRLMPPGAAIYLHQQIRHSRLRLYAGRGHAALIDDADALAALLDGNR